MDVVWCRLGDLENSVTVFKRLALVIDDLRTGYEAMRAKIDAVTGQFFALFN